MFRTCDGPDLVTESGTFHKKTPNNVTEKSLVWGEYDEITILN